MDRGAWQATVYGVTRTELRAPSTHTHTGTAGSWAACPTCLRLLVPAVRELRELRVTHGGGDIDFDVGLALSCRQFVGGRVLCGPLLIYLGNCDPRGSLCFPGLRQGLWVTARGHELVPPKDSLKPGGPAYLGALMALTKLVGAPQCERGENQHLSNCGVTWGQERFPGGICLPARLWLSADPTQGASQALPSPFLSLHLSPSQPVLPPSAPSCPPKTQTGHPELLQRSELRPCPAVRGEKRQKKLFYLIQEVPTRNSLLKVLKSYTHFNLSY